MGSFSSTIKQSTRAPNAGKLGRKTTRIDLFPIMLMLPAIAMLSVVLVGPILYSGFLSFTSYNPVRSDEVKIIGLVNYLELLRSERFIASLIATMLFMVVSVTIELVLGTSLALVLNREFAAKNLVRTLYLLPFMITPVASGLQWKWLFSYDFGLINYALGLLGIQNHPWLNDVSTVWPAIVVVDLWRETPWVMVLMLAGFQSLPDELFEAARMDGASAWHELRYVAFPLLMPVILVVVIMRSIFSFRIFDTIYVLTGGGPANLTQTIALYGYKVGFEYWRVGESSAISVIMLVVLGILGLAYIRTMRGQVE